jgi:hypothetical protein
MCESRIVKFSSVSFRVGLSSPYERSQVRGPQVKMLTPFSETDKAPGPKVVMTCEWRTGV